MAAIGELAAPTGPALRAIVEAALGRPVPIGSARPLAGGYTHDTWLVERSGGEPLVVRLYAARPETCAIEVSLAGRLAGVVPLPELLWADPTGSVAGRPALVLRHVDGLRLDRLLAHDGGRAAAAAGRAVGATLARVGAVTFPRGGVFRGPDLDPQPLGPGSLPEQLLDFARKRLFAPGALPAALRDRNWPLVAAATAALEAVAGARALVHSDFNGKNILLAPEPAGDLRVSALLDWEFAFAGSPLVDVGNLLRFRSELPPGFEPAFLAGFVQHGGDLPVHWDRLARTLDTFALVELLDRPADHPIRIKAVALMRTAADRGRL